MSTNSRPLSLGALNTVRAVVVGVYSGLSLNGDITPKDKLQPFIDDALDQIEFIRGPIDSKWGARRAELGHPKPFKLRYVEIGNEDWLAGRPTGWETYKEYRFPMFLEAINAAHPDIQVIASGSTFDDHDIPKPAAGDYHLYAEPDTLIKEFDRFDNVSHSRGQPLIPAAFDTAIARDSPYDWRDGCHTS